MELAKIAIEKHNVKCKPYFEHSTRQHTPAPFITEWISQVTGLNNVCVYVR